MPKNRYSSAFSYLFKYIKPHKKRYISASSISLILVGTGLINAKITQLLVDSSISGNFSAIIISVLLFLAIILINIALNYISGISASKLAAGASRDLKRHIAKILLGAEYGELIKQKSGDILSTVNADTNIVCEFLAGDLTGLFSQFAMAIGALVYIICANPLLALITFAYTPVGMFFTLTINKKMNRLHPLAAEYKGEALSMVEQALSRIPVIKSFLMEKRIRQNIYNEYDKVYKTEMKTAVWDAVLQPACASTSRMPQLIFMIFAGLLVMNGSMTAGNFIATFDLLTYIIAPTVYFPFMLNRLNRTVASVNRIKSLEKIPQTESAATTEPQKYPPSINIKDLTFGYNPLKPVLSNFNLSYSGGGIISVCGSSGTGKTTLLDLISKLYLPDYGEINVCGNISVVSQDTYIFRDSVLENVRIARSEADDNSVREALRIAGAENFVLALPNGYDTLLGDGNTDLSGGQKQRISLARTILRDSNIWLLDEPTSALDTQTENIILDVIKKASEEKLIIISAHRKSLIDISDKVIFLKGADLNV